MNPCGLAEGGGADFGEAQLGFLFQAVDLAVIKVCGDGVAVHAGGFSDHVFLTLDVTLVFKTIIELLPDGIGKLGAKPCGEFGVVVFGTANPGMQLHSFVTRGLGELHCFGEELGFLLGESIARRAGQADLRSAGSEAEIAIVLT